MKIGFTGTRDGLSRKQQEELRYHITMQGLEMFGPPNEFHHGDCIGADEQAHYIVHELGRSVPFWIVIHPPESDRYRAFCKGDEIHDPKAFLDRNKNIVDSVDLLIACPSSRNKEIRSGTWSTVTKAQNALVPVIVITP